MLAKGFFVFKISLSVDRFMSVWLKTWKRKYFKAKHALITSLVIVTFFTVINLNIWFTFGHREVDENGTVSEYCHSEKAPTLGWMKLWSLVSCKIARFKKNLNSF